MPIQAGTGQAEPGWWARHSSRSRRMKEYPKPPPDKTGFQLPGIVL